MKQRVIKIVLVLSVWLALMSSCTERNAQHQRLFSLMRSTETGVTFVNKIEETSAFNIMKYEYMYNGGGVASGDFNNDGNIDLFFTGNQVGNKLYLNRGSFHFDDITAHARVEGKKGWRTGVTVVDVNDDGLLDVYVCYSGPGTDEARANELFVNNGGDIPTFEDRAKYYGLDATGTYSTQAAFFDYDLDGDLDMFLLNHAKITYSPFYNTKTLRNKRHSRYGNRLYRNENGKFVDVSERASIHGSAINFGLGVAVSDVNNDGWPDIYVTNDYEEQDFFYINNQDGTFRESLKESFRHIARFGMGTDIADYNNDGLADVMVVDMLPEDSYRQKLLKGADEYDKYMLLRDSGYHHQNMRNMLQMNLGNSPSGVPLFSEIGQLAGVSATDWSWSPLFIDLDNDGWKDMFVTNGYLRDYTNLDFLKYTFEDHRAASSKKGVAMDTIALVKEMPSTRLANYCFHNERNQLFKKVSGEWGFEEVSVSNGATYADLDNDGDEDLVVNNLNDEALIYKNETNNQLSNHFIKIRLKGLSGNTNAIGTKVYICTASTNQVLENYSTRGFQSAVSGPLLFGLGNERVVKEIIIQWTDRSFSRLRDVAVDTTLTIRQGDFPYDSVASPIKHPMLFAPDESDKSIQFTHEEKTFVDFKREYLLPYQLSSNGPCMAKGDVNQDGLTDLFIGGGAGQKSELFLATRDRGFVPQPASPWHDDVLCEDTDAAFVDIDGDKDLDLYVVSGSTEFSQNDQAALQDRLYINNGKGIFQTSKALPRENSNGSCVAFFDFDRDGDNDLFIGGRSLPGYYPLPAYSFLLRNDSKNGALEFTDVTPDSLRKAGMINDCLWMDVDDDSWSDLIIVGELMPVLVLKNHHGTLRAPKPIVANSSGLWSTIQSADLDLDGDLDLIAGNMGLNTTFQASVQQPLSIHFHDYNEDGKLDPILTTYNQGRSCIYPSRDEMLEQLPALKKKFVRYEQYAQASLTDILSTEQLAKSKTLSAEMLESSIFINDGKTDFRVMPLPVEAQFSKVNGILVDDFNDDTIPDILIAGNFFPYRVQIGRSDASSGVVLIGRKQLEYSSMLYRQSGLDASGDVRSIQKLETTQGNIVVFGINNDKCKIYKIETDAKRRR